jgi:hypothetical protein
MHGLSAAVEANPRARPVKAIKDRLTHLQMELDKDARK